ncbi:hypothetical protein [Spirillospora sp. NBC_01491]|uniref:hypothetical protein n=1 Tax=Spirillospora sp. NBC_01491 TaxID=2976007 RepID=UPI002E334206|nr:hypothetical protein [Spirillospora sp. NBC_01491]
MDTDPAGSAGFVQPPAEEFGPDEFELEVADVVDPGPDPAGREPLDPELLGLVLRGLLEFEALALGDVEPEKVALDEPEPGVVPGAAPFPDAGDELEDEPDEVLRPEGEDVPVPEDAGLLPDVVDEPEPEPEPAGGDEDEEEVPLVEVVLDGSGFDAFDGLEPDGRSVGRSVAVSSRGAISAGLSSAAGGSSESVTFARSVRVSSADWMSMVVSSRPGLDAAAATVLFLGVAPEPAAFLVRPAPDRPLLLPGSVLTCPPGLAAR